MAVWLVRAGSHGEYEQKFIQEGRVYVTWDGLDVNLAALDAREHLLAAMELRYPDTKPKALTNWVSQVWPFAHGMKAGDIIILPLKSQPAIQIGELTGDYHFEAGGPSPYFHWRSVKWIGESIPRAHFGKDLLFSFGAYMTICRIQRNNAEDRILEMRANGWAPEVLPFPTPPPPIAPADGGASGVATDETTADTDLEELARDQIAQLIVARFKGHGLTRLVEAILKAQGYTTYLSPEGADGGADILAGSGQLGFGHPRLVVEVKSEATPIDRPTVDKLLGAVSKFGADEGLFVSWSGFRSTVQKDLVGSFFRVRLWTQKDLLEQLFTHYADLDETLRAELPLKRIWSVAMPEQG